MRRLPEGAKFAVANMEEKILFLFEIQGQLSDGHWENTMPLDHWELWGDLEWYTIVIDPDKVGPQGFWPRKTGYRINSSELVDCVGDRMLRFINLWNVAPDFMETYFQEHGSWPLTSTNDWDNAEKRASGDKYYAKQLLQNHACGLTREALVELETNPLYDINQLRHFLKGLAKSMKSVVHANPVFPKV